MPRMLSTRSIILPLRKPIGSTAHRAGTAGARVQAFSFTWPKSERDKLEALVLHHVRCFCDPTYQLMHKLLPRQPQSSLRVRRAGDKTTRMAPLPKLVAFDLDATLWYPEMDMTYGPPYKRTNRGTVQDRRGDDIELMGASLAILNELATEPKWQGTEVAYVSRTDCVDWAKQCLKLYEVADGITMHDLGVYKEIYPGCKRAHFKRIHEKSGIDYSDMVFFDNERRNIVDCSPLGITCVYTPHGMTDEAWRQGIDAFQAAKAAQKES